MNCYSCYTRQDDFEWNSRIESAGIPTTSKDFDYALLIERIRGEKSSDGKVANRWKHLIDLSLNTINPKEKLVLHLVYGHKFTLLDIAKLVGRTKGRVEQVFYKAHRRMRHPSRQFYGLLRDNYGIEI